MDIPIITPMMILSINTIPIAGKAINNAANTAINFIKSS